MRGLRLGIANFGISLLAAAPVLAQQVQSPHAEIAAAETNLNLSVGFMHEQYSEHLNPGDAENGSVPGFGIGASVLLPSAWPNIDLYSALTYQFNAGYLHYNGHEVNLSNGAVSPLQATDRAVFNHIEGRFGLGLPLAGSAVEVIPYITAGYMAWNRNVDETGVVGGDEFYRTGLVGVGTKIDAPLTNALVASVSAQWAGLFGGSIDNNDFDIHHAFGSSGDERISLGLDQHINGPLHVFADANWERFNYSGFKGTPNTYYAYEPFSTTTQVGINLGVSYSF